jgi:nitrogen fixation protein FixH
MAAATSTAGWRQFPRYMILIMAFVVAVNARFIYVAIDTFPGAASSDDFDMSNRYNAVLAAVAAQNALGWSEHAGAEGATATVDLIGPDHRALAGATVTAQADRPIGTAAPLDVAFREAAPGHFVATDALPAAGQWDLRLRIAAGGHQVRVTRRIVVK